MSIPPGYNSSERLWVHQPPLTMHIYVDYLEMTTLFTNMEPYCAFYYRFVDNGIGIWLAGKQNSEAMYQEFMNRLNLNNSGRLKWTTTGFADKLEFMDLTISIDKFNQIKFKTYQKPLVPSRHILPTC